MSEVNPKHYTSIMSIRTSIPKTMEAIEVIEAWRLNYHPGSAIKYLLRAGRKPGAHYETYAERERVAEETDAD